MRTLIIIALLSAFRVFGLDIPSLNWQQRSDWISVKTNVPNAVGNGVADDTLALQTALTNAGKTIYIPAGTYKITQTISMTNGLGSAIIGNGRDTKIIWGGPPGGVMFSCNGNPYSRFIGLSWDGQNTASVGFDHAAKQTFETEMQHFNESFRNFTGFGIRIGTNQVLASAEIYYRNCLFTNCSIGIGILTFNDYDNTIDRCEFENCGTAVYCNHGNFYARNTHFQSSTNTDFYIAAEHGCSIRHCSSFGSRMFANESGFVFPLTIQDCQVSHWSANAAISPNGSPQLVFDCGFSGGPPSSFPIITTSVGQVLVTCSNSPLALSSLVSVPANYRAYAITNGTLSGSVSNANVVFIQQTATVPSTTFDAKLNFGAVGNGIADDTTAIQNTINAAATAGGGALAYIPVGSYLISQPLLVTGSGFLLGGSGIKCCLKWGGSAGVPFMIVSNVQNVTVSDIDVGSPNCTVGNNGDDILVTGTGSPSTLTLDGVYVYGKYNLAPNSHGLHIENLPSGSVVQAQAIEGNIWITNCTSSSILFRVSYEGTLTMRGPSSTNNIAGFLTRLGTITNPAFQVFDDQSVTMTDFYVEQSQQIATVSGSGGQNPGRVTIQCPKNDSTNNIVMNINGYAGQVYYGQVQFYSTFTSNTLFQSSSSPNLQLSLVGDYWYQSTNIFNLSPAVTPMLMAGRGQVNPVDSGITTASMAGLGYAMDDLRSVGALDLSLQPYVYPITGVRISGTVTITGSGVFQ